MRPCIVAVAALAAAVVAPRAALGAVNFPQDRQWIPLTCGGQPIGDAAGEVQPPSIDVVGNASNPAAYFFADDSTLFLRLRLNASATLPSGSFDPYSWACLVRTSSSPGGYFVWDGVNGAADPNVVEILEGSRQLLGRSTAGTTAVATYQASADAREVPANTHFGGNSNVFLDWAVSLSDLATAGVALATPWSFFCGTSTTPQIFGGDIVGDEGSCPAPSPSGGGGAGGGVVVVGGGDTVRCANGICSACTTPDACGPDCATCRGGASECNPLVGCAAPCQTDTPCDSRTPLCDLSRGICVGCTDNANCATGSYCDAVSGVCVACPQGEAVCTGPVVGGDGGIVLANGSIEGGSAACNVGGDGSGSSGDWVGGVLGLAAVALLSRKSARPGRTSARRS